MTTPEPVDHLAEAKRLVEKIGAHVPAQAAQAHALIAIAEALQFPPQKVVMGINDTIVNWPEADLPTAAEMMRGYL